MPANEANMEESPSKGQSKRDSALTREHLDTAVPEGNKPFSIYLNQ